MNKKLRTVIAVIIIVILIAVIATIRIIGGKQKQIPPNDPMTAGNTAGNLYNGGLFCESNGVVYFSNSYDSGKLYAMDTASGECRKLSEGNASFICAANGYLYYYTDAAADKTGLGYVRRGRGIYRYDTHHSNNNLITDVTSDGMMLAGNNLIYTCFAEDEKSDGNAKITVNSVAIAGGDPVTLMTGHPKVGCYYGGLMYYSDNLTTGTLNTMDPVFGSTNEVSTERMYLPIVDGQTVYYLDSNDDYHLKSYNLSDGSIFTITDERCDSFNQYQDWIYYQTVVADDPEGYALKRIHTDGSGMETVKMGVHRNICITSDYVYFRDFGSDVPIYRTSTNGSVNVTTFDQAASAVLADR